jgi:hypothetical protein
MSREDEWIKQVIDSENARAEAEIAAAREVAEQRQSARLEDREDQIEAGLLDPSKLARYLELGSERVGEPRDPGSLRTGLAATNEMEPRRPPAPHRSTMQLLCGGSPSGTLKTPNHSETGGTGDVDHETQGNRAQLYACAVGGYKQRENGAYAGVEELAWTHATFFYEIPGCSFASPGRLWLTPHVDISGRWALSASPNISCPESEAEFVLELELKAGQPQGKGGSDRSVKLAGEILTEKDGPCPAASGTISIRREARRVTATLEIVPGLPVRAFATLRVRCRAVGSPSVFLSFAEVSLSNVGEYADVALRRKFIPANTMVWPLPSPHVLVQQSSAAVDTPIEPWP